MTTPTDNSQSQHSEPDGGGPRRYLVTALVMGSGIGFVFALVFYALIWMSADAVSASESALGHIARGDLSAAYAEGAEELRGRHSLEAFTAAMGDLGLTGHGSLNWTSRTVDHRGARLVAEVMTDRGESVSITVTVIRRVDAWRVAGMVRTPPPRRKKKRH